MTVFMLIVADLVPASSETIPLLGIFFTAVMVEMVLMVFTMCYVLKLHLKEPDDGKEISPFMRRFVYDFLAIKFQIRKGKRPPQRKYSSVNYKMTTKPEQNGNTDSDYLLSNGHGNGHTVEFKTKRPSVHPLEENSTARAETTSSNTTAALMEKNLKVMTDKMREEENEKRIKHEYEVCATTLDILSMIVFVALFFLITLVYFVSTT